MEEAPTCLVTYPVEYFFFFLLCPELLQDNGTTCCPLVHASTATCPAPTHCHRCIPIHALQLVKYFFFSSFHSTLNCCRTTAQHAIPSCTQELLLTLHRQVTTAGSPHMPCNSLSFFFCFFHFTSNCCRTGATLPCTQANHHCPNHASPPCTSPAVAPPQHGVQDPTITNPP